MTLHRDRYRTTLHNYGIFIDRRSETFIPASDAKYAEGYDNGYMLTTRLHEDGECEAWKPGPLVEVEMH